MESDQVYYAAPQIRQTQEVQSAPVVQQKIVSQPIITRRVVSQPIIKQQILQTPIIRKTEVQRPVYTEQVTQSAAVQNQIVNKPIPVAVPGTTTYRETLIQPYQKIIEESINVQQGESEVINRPDIVRPIIYNEETITKGYQAPNREVYYQPVYEKQIINQAENVEFVPSEDRIVNLNPLTRRPVMRENERLETIVKPGKEFYNQTYIQPIIQREQVNLNVSRGDDKYIQL